MLSVFIFSTFGIFSFFFHFLTFGIFLSFFRVTRLMIGSGSTHVTTAVPHPSYLPADLLSWNAIVWLAVTAGLFPSQLMGRSSGFIAAFGELCAFLVFCAFDTYIDTRTRTYPSGDTCCCTLLNSNLFFCICFRFFRDFFFPASTRTCPSGGMLLHLILFYLAFVYCFRLV